MFMNKNKRKYALYECTAFMIMSNFMWELFSHWKMRITDD